MNSSTTVSKWLKHAYKNLVKESGTAQLDAEVLLASVLNVDRSWLHAHPEEIILTNKLVILDEYLKRRIAHEPIAYILNKCEFYGREFYITNDVLVPRPESEMMIEMLSKIINNNPENITIIDVGCGSGALGLTAALEFKIKKVLGIDISDKCLEVTKINSEKYNIPTELLKSNLLTNVDVFDVDQQFIILANLPYVPDSHTINADALTEPKNAIFGGPDGLSLYRELFKQLKGLKPKICYVLTEALPPQHEELNKIAELNNFKQLSNQDFIQLFVSEN